MWRAVVSILVLSLLGCATTPDRDTVEEIADDLDGGYALLASLLRDQGRVDTLLALKSVSGETRQLVRDIAATSRDGHARLEELSRLEPPLRLDAAILPAIERQTRDAIAADTARDLLLSGRTFEAKLLLVQSAALRYGRVLAGQIAPADSNRERQAWLASLADDYKELHRRLVARVAIAR